MTTALVERPTQAEEIERVLITGDLSRLTPEQRVSYYNKVCSSLGLNPFTKPFEYLTLGGKLVLYARKDATEQLRKLHGVSITDLTSTQVGDVFVVTAKATDQSLRTDAATGAVPTVNLKGEALANALMKAETKAKRRVTLSICGLGMLDETEIETIPQSVVVDAPQPIEVPAGAFQIVKVTSHEWGAEVVFVNQDGEDVTHKASDRQLAQLCEQIAQEGIAVTLELQRITRGKNAGKDKLVGVRRIPKVGMAVMVEEFRAATKAPEDVTADDIPF